LDLGEELQKSKEGMNPVLWFYKALIPPLKVDPSQCSLYTVALGIRFQHDFRSRHKHSDHSNGSRLCGCIFLRQHFLNLYNRFWYFMLQKKFPTYWMASQKKVFGILVFPALWPTKTYPFTLRCFWIMKAHRSHRWENVNLAMQKGRK
jgi:hypothetical protein